MSRGGARVCVCVCDSVMRARARVCVYILVCRSRGLAGQSNKTVCVWVYAFFRFIVSRFLVWFANANAMLPG